MIDPNVLIQQGNDLDTLDQLYNIQNLLNGYAIKNLLLVGQSDQSQVVTYINPNLYSIAVQYYGDMDYWPVIAKANNLSDPEYLGTIALLIPPKTSVNPGAILNP